MKLNSKEALERLIDKTGIMNDTCARLYECIKCGKCQIDDELVETCDDYNLVITIKQDINRLEKLEKENKVLREKVNHFKNVKNRMRRNCNFYEKENAKLKKVIEILKDYFEIWLNYEEEEIFGGFEINGYHQINKQEYELLKEVLGNGR